MMNRIKRGVGIVFIYSLLISFIACNTERSSYEQTDTLATAPDSASFQREMNGKIISLYKIRNRKMIAYFTNYGARIVSLVVPDKDGKPTDVVVGFGSLDGYLNSTEPYFGATIGRYANRLSGGQFSLDNITYQIPPNNGPNALHGGKNGFQSVVWDVEQPDPATLIFSYFSEDGEEGFPGNLTTTVTYSLHKKELKVVYEAETDRKTIVNLTNHAFFNLNGEGSGDILDHTVQIFADRYTPVDSTLIPTGELASVRDTPFDFTSPEKIGKRINEEDEQLIFGKGYDHNYVLSEQKQDHIAHAATVRGDLSGIKMRIFTTEPGLQFYSGNFMRGKNIFKNGSKDEFRTAFAMEPQHFPDSPNQPSFPSVVLEPTQKYQTVSVYKFSK